MRRDTLTPEGVAQIRAAIDRAVVHQERTIREHEQALDSFFVALHEVTATRNAMLQGRRRLKQAVERARTAGLL